MIRKMIPVFTAAAISMSITFVVPVAITAVSSVAFVSEAQAFGFGSIKKRVKKAARKTTSTLQKADRRIRKAGRSTKDIITCKTCPDGRWIDQHKLKGVLATPGKHIKRAGKAVIRDTKGAGRIALGTAKSAGRTFDRRTSQACVALGSCQGTITRSASSYTKVTVKRR